MNKAELLAKHSGKSEQNETNYTEVRTEVTKQLQRSMNIKSALDNFDYKLKLAAAEFDQELKTIEQNFNSTGNLE